LPRLLARFRQSHPNTEFEFQTSVSEILERLVAKATLQIAVTDRQPPGPDLACEPLRREKVRAFVAAGHRLARRQNITLAEMLAEPLIIRGGKGVCGTTETALKRLREEGWTVRIGMRCDGPDSIKAAVRQRMGVGLAFEDSVKFEVAAGEFKILDVRDLRLDGGSYIIYSKPRPLSPLAQEFLELLREAKTVLLPGARSNRSSRCIASLRSKSLGEKQRMNRASALG
jgi:DNA-binding transcriptional LysR family regulator